MIARLTGRLVDHQGMLGIIDVQGVGYAVNATRRDLEHWNAADEAVAHTYTVVREDTLALYGFSDRADRKAFEVLLGISKVGPKVALAALDTLSADELATAVARDDVLALSRIPGVGKKTAQRLALELKGKLHTTFTPTATKRAPSAPADALPLALARLGYTKSEIDRAQAGLQQDGVGTDAPISDRLRGALRLLSGGT